MRRLQSVSDDSATNVNYPLGIQSRIRIFLPSEVSAFTATVQISSEADVDESLQGPIAAGNMLTPSFEDRSINMDLSRARVALMKLTITRAPRAFFRDTSRN